MLRMKIAVLGATGPSGLLVVSQSLARGHEVKALVRNPSKITQTHEKLEVIKTDIFSTEELSKHLPGCDAIISCIGGRPGFSTVTLYSECIKAVTEAMKSVQLSRIICLSSWYSRSTPQEPFFWKIMVRPIIGRMLSDLDRMETFLSESKESNIDYTVVRLPYLNLDEKQDKEILVEEGMVAQNTSYKMPRANVASFVIDCAEQGLYKKQLIAIGLKNK